MAAILLRQRLIFLFKVKRVQVSLTSWEILIGMITELKTSLAE